MVRIGRVTTWAYPDTGVGVCHWFVVENGHLTVAAWKAEGSWPATEFLGRYVSFKRVL